MRLRYTQRALDDLSSILDYIAAHSPAGANSVQARLQAAINRLEHYPHIGARTEDPTVRRLTALPYPYIVFYEIDSDDVIIHAIRHASRASNTP